MFERQQSDQQKAREVMKDGGVVIYWRPGCPYCEALDWATTLPGSTFGRIRRLKRT